MLKGLPASGKSMYAKELVAQGWKRVNKDDLRAMIDDSKWSRGNEKEIKNVEAMIVNHYLFEGYSVVVDDTNFVYEDFWREVAKGRDIDFEVKYIEASLGECIERDAKRGEKSVGAEVICGLYERYVHEEVAYNPELPDCYIVDIDGTLAIKGDRSPYDFAKVGLDTPNTPMIKVYKALKATEIDGTKMFIFSGREDSCRDETEKWLSDNEIFYNDMFMRKSDDKRKDNIVKQEIYEEHVKGKYNVLGVFDDRLQVCRMWYEQGLPLFRIGNPDGAF